MLNHKVSPYKTSIWDLYTRPSYETFLWNVHMRPPYEISIWDLHSAQLQLYWPGFFGKTASFGSSASILTPTNVGKRGTPSSVYSWNRYVIMEPTLGGLRLSAFVRLEKEKNNLEFWLLPKDIKHKRLLYSVTCLDRPPHLHGESGLSRQVACHPRLDLIWINTNRSSKGGLKKQVAWDSLFGRFGCIAYLPQTILFHIMITKKGFWI